MFNNATQDIYPPNATQPCTQPDSRRMVRHVDRKSCQARGSSKERWGNKEHACSEERRLTRDTRWRNQCPMMKEPGEERTMCTPRPRSQRATSNKEKREKTKSAQVCSRPQSAESPSALSAVLCNTRCVLVLLESGESGPPEGPQNEELPRRTRGRKTPRKEGMSEEAARNCAKEGQATRR